MRAIRKGNDINILWDIMHEVEGQSQPYDLTGKDLTLYLGTPYGREKVPGITTQGNTVVWTYWGKDQKCIGIHSLTLVINEGSEFMQTVDVCKAFQIVERSCMAGGEDEEGIRTETINLNSRIDIAAIMPDTELNRNSMNVVTNQAIVEGIENAVQSYEERFGELSESVDDKLGEVDGILKSKADKDGHYPEFTSGFADNLVGRGESIPAEYSFRASGGKSIEDGTARIKTLKGNAVVWNQLYPADWVQGISTSVNGVISIVGTLTENYIRFNEFNSNIQGHKYLFILEADAVFNGKLFSLLNRVENVTIANGMACIFHTNSNATLQRYIGIKSLTVGETLNATARIRQIDLTQMFGAGNEPTTIEEYNARKPIVEDENAYNEGEVIPFTAEGIKSVGDNAWDEEWEEGDINLTTGENMDSTDYIRSKNYIQALPNQTYHIIAQDVGRILYYDENYGYIGKSESFGGTRDITTPMNCRYMRYRWEGQSYNGGILIRLEHTGWMTDTGVGYKPYEQDIRKIDSRILEEFPNGMMPWDKVYNKNGKGYIVKGSGSVDMGTMNWSYLAASASYPYGFFYSDLNNDLRDKMFATMPLSPRYAIGNLQTDKSIYPNSSNNMVYVMDSAYTDVASFKTAMAGVPLYYELAEPTIIEYDEPFNLDYLVWDFGTEEIIADKPSAPLKADIIYQFNAVDEIRELRQLIATMQAQLASLTSNNGGQ